MRAKVDADGRREVVAELVTCEAKNEGGFPRAAVAAHEQTHKVGVPAVW